MPNRLHNQTSPYLLQHAHNPVDWWPWCDEAFEEATRRGVPVFLSIGYSTCYWCHVMERESFEDVDTAKVLNELFVPIKVDREERPDIDEVYMAATVIMTGHGGWPMSVFIEPKSRRPFWCGTYFPKSARAGSGMPTFTQVLGSLSKAYRDQGDVVTQQSEAVAAAIMEQVSGSSATAQLGQEQVTGAVQALLKIYDRVDGGFGSAPKFPQPVFLEFLLDARERAGDDSTMDAIDIAVRRTLDKMSCGGMHDHVGGGFHRYSVDAHWLVPHFEKMLYDNAQLARLYARAARFYGDQWYAHVARRTFAYVAREMTAAEGGFCSAQDAEVDGREGLNYLWTPAEVKDAVGPDDAAAAIEIYGLNNGPNFKDPHHPSLPPLNVLRLEDRPGRLASRFELSAAGLDERLASINAKLYEARQARKQPRLDDKVLTAWNGLMIGAFAVAAAELEDPSLLQPAERAATFILDKLVEGAGASRRLLRTHRAGQSKTPAFLEDHAFLINAFIELARATQGDVRSGYLASAKDILALADAAFFDAQSGAWYDTRENSSDLFVRSRSTHDGAVPAGVSVMIHNLLDLAELTGDSTYHERALRSLIAISSAVAENPVGTINSTRALLRLLVSSPADAATSLGAGGNTSAPPRPPTAEQVVEVYASTERVQVAKDSPAELTLFVKIADGYHTPAADPGDSPDARSLIPFRVDIVNGTGVAAYAGYPDGEPLTPGQARMYSGSFELPVALELHGEWSGRPLIRVMYQACTDTECLAPVSVELDIAIDRA